MSANNKEVSESITNRLKFLIDGRSFSKKGHYEWFKLTNSELGQHDVYSLERKDSVKNARFIGKAIIQMSTMSILMDIDFLGKKASRTVFIKDLIFYTVY